MAEMGPAALDAFLRGTRIAKLATLNEDGSPNIVPVWFEWDGEVARLFTDRDSSKVERIKRDPRVALSVEEGVGIPEAWVSIEGTAHIEGGTLALAWRLIERYYTPEKVREVWPSWEALEDQWVTVVVTPVRIRSSGG